MTSAVALHNVSAAYSGHVALRNATLDVGRGDFLGVLGPNGAGKTTLVTVANGLTRISFGEISLFGRPVRHSDFSRLRRSIGYVPQHQKIDPRAPVTCREAVLLGRFGRLGVLRRRGPADEQKVSEAMELTGITALAERPVGQVSGGEKQKVALARCLAQEPDLLLLDEPTANLDPRSVREFLALVGGLWRRLGLTIVMVTHQLDHLPAECGRVALLKLGRIEFTGPRAEALEPRRLSELFDIG